MTCVMSRNAKFRKNRRGKWKNPAIPKVLGFSDPMIPSCFLLYVHVCLLCHQNQDRGVRATGSHWVPLQGQRDESLYSVH